MATVKSLERLLSKNQKERNVLRDQLDELQQQKVLPTLKRKFEGKFFSYDNGFNDKERWLIYCYCHEITSTSWAVVDHFQFVPGEGWRFSIRSQEAHHLLQTEITSIAYHDARNEMFSAINRI
jgi:hypothetical protein